MSEDTRIRRNLSPAQEFQSFLLHNDLEHLHCLLTLKLILWKEEHTDTIITFLSKLHAKLVRCLLEKLVRDLKQYTNTVTGLSFCILTGTMFQILHNPKCIADCLVCLNTLNVYYCTNTAVVMLKAAIIHALLCDMRSFISYLRHACLSFLE